MFCFSLSLALILFRTRLTGCWHRHKRLFCSRLRALNCGINTECDKNSSLGGEMFFTCAPVAHRREPWSPAAPLYAWKGLRLACCYTPQQHETPSDNTSMRTSTTWCEHRRFFFACECVLTKLQISHKRRTRQPHAAAVES